MARPMVAFWRFVIFLALCIAIPGLVVSVISFIEERNEHFWFKYGTDDIYTQKSDVQIGTSSAEVNTSISSLGLGRISGNTSRAVFELIHDGVTDNDEVLLKFFGHNTTVLGSSVKSKMKSYRNAVCDKTGAVFMWNENITPCPQLYVGINTLEPSYSLDVTGNIHGSGNATFDQSLVVIGALVANSFNVSSIVAASQNVTTLYVDSIHGETTFANINIGSCTVTGATFSATNLVASTEVNTTFIYANTIRGLTVSTDVAIAGILISGTDIVSSVHITTTLLSATTVTTSTVSATTVTAGTANITSSLYIGNSGVALTQYTQNSASGVTVTGFNAGRTISMSWTITGNVATVYFGTVSGTLSGTAITITLPAAVTPAVGVYACRLYYFKITIIVFSITVEHNGTTNPGYIQISNVGSVAAFTAFSGGDTGGWVWYIKLLLNAFSNPSNSLINYRNPVNEIFDKANLLQFSNASHFYVSRNQLIK